MRAYGLGESSAQVVRRRADGLELTVDNGLDALQSIEIAHCKCHRALPHLQSPAPGKGARNYSWAALKRTFESGQNRTFELSLYIETSHNVYYVKSRIWIKAWGTNTLVAVSIVGTLPSIVSPDKSAQSIVWQRP